MVDNAMSMPEFKIEMVPSDYTDVMEHYNRYME